MNKRILYITPHLSTGGLPQYLYKTIDSIKDVFEVYLIEYSDITGGKLITIRDKILSIIDKDKFYTLPENKLEILNIIDKINPDIIHFEEIPELFMDQELTNTIYRKKDRKYCIIETSHTSTFDINNKQYLPDKFIFVSEYQIQQYREIDVSKVLVEYPIEYTERPNREESLKNLGLDPNKKHILNIGLYTPGKNQKEFFEYAKVLPEYEFHSIGNQADNFKEYWEPLMKDKPNNLTWWNERTDVNKFYQAMDLFLFTSTLELMPLVVKEAISYKIPILIYNLPVYLNYFDKYPIHYLNNNFDVNIQKIKKILECDKN